MDYWHLETFPVPQTQTFQCPKPNRDSRTVGIADKYIEENGLMHKGFSAEFSAGQLNLHVVNAEQSEFLALFLG